jgi:hypothetical protein
MSLDVSLLNTDSAIWLRFMLAQQTKRTLETLDPEARA